MTAFKLSKTQNLHQVSSSTLPHKSLFLKQKAAPGKCFALLTPLFSTAVHTTYAKIQRLVCCLFKTRFVENTHKLVTVGEGF